MVSAPDEQFFPLDKLSCIDGNLQSIAMVMNIARPSPIGGEHEVE
jgi:hypothetical protein